MSGVSAHAQEETYIKDNQLCIKNVCVGDDIRTLKAIKLKPARMDIGDRRLVTQIKVTNDDMKKFIKQYMSPSAKVVHHDIVKYLWERKIDNHVIDVLSKEKGFCNSIGELTGEFVTESGIPTSIYVDIRVSNNYQEQAWRVVGIRQQFPSNATWEQRQQMSKVFLERYKQSELASPNFGWQFSGSELVLSEIPNLLIPRLKDTSRESNDDKLKKYPGCGSKLIAD